MPKNWSSGIQLESLPNIQGFWVLKINVGDEALRKGCLKLYLIYRVSGF